MKKLIILLTFAVLMVTACADFNDAPSVEDRIPDMNPYAKEEVQKLPKVNVSDLYCRFGMTLGAVNNQETKVIADYQEKDGTNATADITRDVVIKNVSKGLKVIKYAPTEHDCVIKVVINGGTGIYSFCVAYLDSEMTVYVQKKGAVYKILYPQTAPNK